jgi:hypothetical protein
MGSLTSQIRQMIDNMVLGNKPKNRNIGRLGIHDVEESPRLSVEAENSINIRVHKVANGWVVNRTIENSGSYDSETHVCGNNDDLLAKVNELVAMFKLAV